MKIRWKVPHENIHGEASFYLFYFLFLCIFCFILCLFGCKFEVWRKKTHLILFQIRFFFIIISFIFSYFSKKLKLKKKQICSLRFFCQFLMFSFFFCFFIFVNLRDGEKNPKKQIKKKKIKKEANTSRRTDGHREGLQNRPRKLPMQNVVSDRRTHGLSEFI